MVIIHILKYIYLQFIISMNIFRKNWNYTLNIEIADLIITTSIYVSINHKLRERKVKTFTRNWRDHKMTGTHKHTETVSRYFDWHGRLSQSKESKCLWTHDKDGVTREFTKGATRGLRRDGWREILQFLVRVFTFLSLNLWFFVLRYFPFHVVCVN